MPNIPELTSLVNSIVAQRSAQLPQIEAQLNKLQQIEAALKDLKSFSNNPDFESVFSTIPIDKTFATIAQAKRVLERALQRLGRTNSSIAVAGKARQGKSQLLQMLTGLGNEQIPTGDTNVCTAARSRIINDPNNQSATVHFLSQREFLEKKIWPAFEDDPNRKEALGLSPSPESVQLFLSNPLPELTDASPSRCKFYEALKKIRDDINADPSIAAKLGSAPAQVSLSEVAKYVTKDNDELPNYYHVVDYVDILTPFAVGLPDGIVVFDLPGLGEMTPDIRETALSAIKNDADIVLFLRKLDTDGDAWKEEDLETFDMLSKICQDEDIQPNNWVFLILNLDTRPSDNNEKNVESMLHNVPKGYTPVVCNCGSQDAVRSMISDNMQTLLTNAENIDSACVCRAKMSMELSIQAAKEALSMMIETVKNSAQSGLDIDEKFEDFKADLRTSFKAEVKERIGDLEDCIRKSLQEHFMEVYNTMEEYYKQMDDAQDEFPADFPTFTPKKLVQQFKGGRGSDEVVNEAIRSQLRSIVELMKKPLTQSCEEIRSIYLDRMAELIVHNNPVIQKVIELNNSSSETTSEEKLNSIAKAVGRIESISTSGIIAALNNLLGLNLTYEQQILPIVYENPSILDFDPYYKGTDEKPPILRKLKETINYKFQGDFNTQKDALYNWLKEKSEEIISALLENHEDCPIFRIAHIIYLIIAANYRNFVNQFIWSKTIEKEWRDYYNNQKAVLW